MSSKNFQNIQEASFHSLCDVIIAFLTFQNNDGDIIKNITKSSEKNGLRVESGLKTDKKSGVSIQVRILENSFLNASFISLLPKTKRNVVRLEHEIAKSSTTRKTLGSTTTTTCKIFKIKTGAKHR